MSKHHPLGPSSASRWLACPGSHAQIEKAKNVGVADEGNASSREGTLAHLAAQACLELNIAPDALVGARINDDERIFGEEDVPFVQQYVDYVREIYNGCGFSAEMSVEERLDLSDVVEGCFGTADVVVRSDASIHIIDFKFGKGVKVEAEGNRQLMMYAMALRDEWKDGEKRVTLHIVQPRYPTQSAWRVEPERLEAMREEMTATARNILDGLADDALYPGETQCRFCPAKPVCPALLKETGRLLMLANGTAGALVGPDDLAVVLDKAPMVEKFIKAARAEAMRRLEAGEKVEGWKLAHNSPHRRWNANAALELEALLGEDAWEKPKLIGLTKAQALLKKRGLDADIDPFTERPAPSAVLARAADKRPAINRADATALLPEVKDDADAPEAPVR